MTDEELTRVLNALRYELGEEEEKDCTGPNRCPVCAALLVVFRSEVEAFYCLNALVSNKCPAYFAKDLGGARNGAALVSAVLKCVDYGLYQAIVEPDPISFEEIYVFPLLTSFFTCLPPLAEVLKVWDALFAVGPHYVVLLVVAHTLLYRDHIITKQGGGGGTALFSIQPRNLPKLQADVLLDTARQLTVPALLYDLITQHTFRTVTIPPDILQGDDDDDDRRRRRRPPDCSCSSA